MIGTPIEIAATSCLALAILHSFAVKLFQRIACRFEDGSVGENFFHLLGEVEVVFGFWAGVLFLILAAIDGSGSAIRYLEGRNFTEPAFVFVIMVISSTRPILSATERVISGVARLLPMHGSVAFFFASLTVGPLLGSFITEPAAMTVTALLLLDRIFLRTDSMRLKYATIGLLFVNISIGGTLTPFAAPPVLMVAQGWGWDLAFMLENFGWKAVLAVLASTSLVAWRFSKELRDLTPETKSAAKALPFWVIAIHVAFLVLVVLSSHFIVLFFSLFLFFLGVVTVTREFQSDLKLKEGLLVAFFLGGLVVLGGMQGWWLEPILRSRTELPLYLGAIGLTAFTDNAALTYLGSQVPTLTEASRYALVSGAVVGGGLTVIANAPNPAGFGILNASFGKEGINPLLLFTHALVPTLIAGVCFWFL